MTTLQAQISTCFSQPNSQSAASLATLVNRQSNTADLDPILNTIINQFILSSFAQRSQIDSIISFLSSAANQIELSVAHPGHSPEDRYATTQLRASKGPGIVSEHLSHTLYRALWGHTSRARTPDEELDREHPKKYYADASTHATILARAFAIQPGFRDHLWREVEDIFVKGLFSGPEQEPGVFIALSAVLLGAGAEIREYMAQGVKGKGMAWLWYDDVRTGADREWDWPSIVEALGNEPEPEISPSYVRATFERAKKHVCDSQGEMRSWDSQRLANEAFVWVDE